MSIGLVNSCGWIPCQLSFPSRPTCSSIRVGSFRALIQHTEVDMLVTSRRLRSQKRSRKILSVQQYRTSTWWRNLNAFVTNRTHLPMKLCSNKALRGNLCVDLRTEVTCARSVSHLPTISRATDKHLYTEGSTPKKKQDTHKNEVGVKFPLLGT